MTDLPKISGLQKVISDVKAMISSTLVPEANKDDPLGYYVFELSKLVKELTDNHTKQGDIVANMNNMLGNLSQALISAKKIDPKPIGETSSGTLPSAAEKTDLDDKCE